MNGVDAIVDLLIAVLENMKVLAEVTDKEIAHSEADDYLVGVISYLRDKHSTPKEYELLTEILKEYRKIDKWYA